MKLKKIASLALAGIMAVSMLAGCKDGTSDNGGNGNGGDITPTSTTASVLRENLDGEARRNVEAVSNSELDAALKSAVADYCNDLTINEVVGEYQLIDFRNWELAKAVISDMDAKNSIDALGKGIEEDTVAVEVFAIDKSVSDNYVLKMLAERINDFCDDTHLVDKSDSQEYDYDYEISASIVSVDDNDSTVDQGAKFVAFAVTQKVTKYV